MQPFWSRLDFTNLESSLLWLIQNWFSYMGIMGSYVTNMWPITEGAILYKSQEGKKHLKRWGKLSSANSNQKSRVSQSTKQTSNNKNHHQAKQELLGSSLSLFNWDSPDTFRNLHHFQISKGIFRGTIIYQLTCIFVVDSWRKVNLSLMTLNSALRG